jgi:hypothetical protein
MLDTDRQLAAIGGTATRGKSHPSIESNRIHDASAAV